MGGTGLYYNWTTSDEIGFLKDIGTHTTRQNLHLTKMERFRMYLQASKQRVDWNGINKYQIIAFLESSIEEMLRRDSQEEIRQRAKKPQGRAER